VSAAPATSPPASQTPATQNTIAPVQPPQTQPPQTQTAQIQTAQAPQSLTSSAPGPTAQAQPASTSQTVTTTASGGGQTTVIQNPGQLINAVTNSANGQDIRLDTQVNVVLPGFDAVQRSQLLSSMGMKIGADGSLGIVSALPH
jgi:hypothetical protein